MRIGLPTPSLHSRILVVEDQQLVAEGLRQLLEPEFRIAGVVTDYADIGRQAQALTPDLILLSISRSFVDVLQVAEHVTEILPPVKILYLTVDTDPNLAIAAFDHGRASGYLLKTCSASELTTAIRTVLKGNCYVSSSLKDMVDALRWERRKGAFGTERLTKRQQEVLSVLLESKTMKIAGSALGLTARTIAFHKYQIMERVGAKSHADLVKFAVRNRLLAPEELVPGWEEIATKASVA